MRKVNRTLKDWENLAYNAHSMLKEMWSFDEITYMPVWVLLHYVDYITPKLKEIAKQREAERLKAELANKQAHKQPRGIRH